MICNAQRAQTVRVDGAHFLQYNFDLPADEADPNGDAARFYYLHENKTQVRTVGDTFNSRLMPLQ